VTVSIVSSKRITCKVGARTIRQPVTDETGRCHTRRTSPKLHAIVLSSIIHINYVVSCIQAVAAAAAARNGNTHTCIYMLVPRSIIDGPVNSGEYTAMRYTDM
jgi:hypothetical protein